MKDHAGVKGVYRVDPTTNTVELATPFHRRPNGLAFSPDGRILWVADSSIGAFSWTAYVDDMCLNAVLADRPFVWVLARLWLLLLCGVVVIAFLPTRCSINSTL